MSGTDEGGPGPCTLHERALQMQRTTTYREQSRVFLAQAHFEELAKGDLQQASEKGWGAASQMVKAIAQERTRNGWVASPEPSAPAKRSG